MSRAYVSTNDCSICHINAIIYSVCHYFDGFTICRRNCNIDTYRNRYIPPKGWLFLCMNRRLCSVQPSPSAKSPHTLDRWNTSFENLSAACIFISVTFPPRRATNFTAIFTEKRQIKVKNHVNWQEIIFSTRIWRYMWLFYFCLLSKLIYALLNSGKSKKMIIWKINVQTDMTRN